MRTPNADSFLRDVHAHKMTVLLDSGLYRHVRLKKPGDSNLWFDMVTWPGTLTISGDMGTWTFSRVDDMFTFFRGSRLEINASYWAEKLQHGTHGGSDGGKIWDADLFKSELLEQVKGYGLMEKDLSAVVMQLKEEVLTSEDSPHYLMNAALEFDCDMPSGSKFQFESCELPDGMAYAYHFVWCLYAIVWGIQQWDAAQQGRGPATAAGEQS